MCMARHTSVYLPDGLDAAVRASGATIPELIRRGLQLEPPGQKGREPPGYAPDGYPPVADLARWIRDILGRLDQLDAIVRPVDSGGEQTDRLTEIEHRLEALSGWVFVLLNRAHLPPMTVTCRACGHQLPPWTGRGNATVKCDQCGERVHIRCRDQRQIPLRIDEEEATDVPA